MKLINYRKSGQPFLNLISLQPICDRDGLFRFMLGTNCEISEKYTPVGALARARVLRCTPRRSLARALAHARRLASALDPVAPGERRRSSRS